MIIKDITQKKMECPNGCGPAACWQKRSTMFKDIHNGKAEYLLVVYSVHTCAKCGKSVTQHIPYSSDGGNRNCYTRRVKDIFIDLLEQGMSRREARKRMDREYGVSPNDTTSWKWASEFKGGCIKQQESYYAT